MITNVKNTLKINSIKYRIPRRLRRLCKALYNNKIGVVCTVLIALFVMYYFIVVKNNAVVAYLNLGEDCINDYMQLH